MALPFDTPLENETDKAYAAFCAYRDLPPNDRTVDAVYTQIKHPKSIERKVATKSWYQWSTDNSWVERARASDAHNDRVFLKAREQSIVKAQRLVMKHEIEAALLMVERGTAMMKMPILTKVDDNGRTLKPANASYISQGAKIVVEGIKMLRLAGGMTGEIKTLELTGREGLWQDLVELIQSGVMNVQQAKETIADESLAEEFVGYMQKKGVMVDV